METYGQVFGRKHRAEQPVFDDSGRWECSCCKKVKPLAAFRTNPDGRPLDICKACELDKRMKHKRYLNEKLGWNRHGAKKD